MEEVGVLLERDELAAAEARLSKLLQRHGDSIPALLMQARIYYHTGRYEEAIALARKAVSADPLCEAAYMLLGRASARMGQVDMAIEQLRKVLYLKPRLPLAYFELGNLYQLVGQLDRAVKAYQNAIHTARSPDAAWEGGFTPELLISVCQRNIARLQNQSSVSS